MAIAYCVKCREKREMDSPNPIVMESKRGKRYAIKGTCPVCGTKMFKIVSKADYDEATS